MKTDTRKLVAIGLLLMAAVVVVVGNADAIDNWSPAECAK